MGYRYHKTVNCQICGGKAIARRLCRYHYYQAHKKGTLHKYQKISEKDAFLNRINKTQSCWLWTGTTNFYGYGIFLLPGEKPVRAHRYAYELFVGKIPKHKIIMHTCDNPPCVNPKHLRVGTKLDNNRDCAKKRRRPAGLSHWNCKLSDEDVKAIRKDIRTHQEIAKAYHVSQSTITNIKLRKARIYVK